MLGEVKDEILYKMVGMAEIKSQLMKIVEKIVAAEKRASLGYRVVPPKPFHMVFLGNSGTGKSMVARSLGKLFYLAGVLPSYNVIEMQGQRARIKEAKGGILLVNVDENEHNSEVLQEILSLMDGRESAVIFAGQRKPLNHCMKLNKEIYKNLSLTLHFSNFSCEELALMLKAKMSDEAKNSSMHGFKLQPCSVDVIEKLIAKETFEELRNKLNGCLIDPILQEAKKNLDMRGLVFYGDGDDPSNTITLGDLEAGIHNMTRVYKNVL